MKNSVQKGDSLNFTAPSGGVTSGVPVLIGALLVVPVASADQDETFAGQTCGVFTCSKLSAQAWTEGAIVYWDDSNSRFTTAAASGLFKAGIAAAVAADPSATGVVRFDGVALTAEA